MAPSILLAFGSIASIEILTFGGTLPDAGSQIKLHEVTSTCSEVKRADADATYPVVPISTQENVEAVPAWSS